MTTPNDGGAGARRPLMGDDGAPTACEGCGGEALRNGTRLCAACWSDWREERGYPVDDEEVA